MRAHLRLAEEYARAAREATAAREHGLAAALFARAIKLSALVDDSWAEVTEIDPQRSFPAQSAPVQVHAIHHAGESAHTKRARVCAALREEEANALFVAAPDDNLAASVTIRHVRPVQINYSFT